MKRAQHDLHVLMVPDYREGNPYQSLLCNALANHNVHVNFDEIPSNLFPFCTLFRRHKKIDILHIHWMTDIIKRIGWAKTTPIFLIKLFLLALDLTICRCFRRKIIWTIHNKFAHDQLNKNRELVIRKLVATLVNRVVLHSEEAINEISKLYGKKLNARMVIHGNYSDVYPKPRRDKGSLKRTHRIPENARIITYVGIIKPYKGIEKLLNAFASINNENVYLVIAGKVSSLEYMKSLQRMIDGNPRIITNFKFLSEQELVDTIALSDCICLPFSSTLTSGSTILAMSLGKALILSESAKVFGCVPDEGTKYFCSENELKQILNQVNEFDLQKMGKLNFEACSDMTWLKAAKATDKVYRELL